MPCILLGTFNRVLVAVTEEEPAQVDSMSLVVILLAYLASILN